MNYTIQTSADSRIRTIDLGLACSSIVMVYYTVSSENKNPQVDVPMDTLQLQSKTNCI